MRGAVESKRLVIGLFASQCVGCMSGAVWVHKPSGLVSMRHDAIESLARMAGLERESVITVRRNPAGTELRLETRGEANNGHIAVFDRDSLIEVVEKPGPRAWLDESRLPHVWTTEEGLQFADGRTIARQWISDFDPSLAYFAYGHGHPFITVVMASIRITNQQPPTLPVLVGSHPVLSAMRDGVLVAMVHHSDRTIHVTELEKRGEALVIKKNQRIEKPSGKHGAYWVADLAATIHMIAIPEPSDIPLCPGKTTIIDIQTMERWTVKPAAAQLFMAQDFASGKLLSRIEKAQPARDKQ